jgi:hypothetical protein
MSNLTLLRYVGNAFVIIGYFIMVWGDLQFGLVIKLIAGSLLIPSFVKHKMWDTVIICSFFFMIELAKLLQLLLS